MVIKMIYNNINTTKCATAQKLLVLSILTIVMYYLISMYRIIMYTGLYIEGYIGEGEGECRFSPVYF